MYIVFTVLIFIVCVLLVLIVLVQNSKGGGLASGFTSSNQYMGVRKTADFLEKATWTLAASLLVLCLLATITVNSGNAVKKSALEEQIQNATESTALPNFPTAPTKSDNSNSTTDQKKTK